MSVLKNTIKKIGHRACFRDMGKLTSFILVPTLITRVISSFVVHFAVAEARIPRVTLEKELHRYKVSSI